MFFCTLLFKMLYELVIKMNSLFTSSKKKAKLEENINKDLQDEFGDSVRVEEVDGTELETHIMKRQ